jgi:hypothetical protein
MKRILLITLLCCSAFAEERPMTAADAKMVFERFKSMAGTWKEKSGKGWTGTSKYELAAKGTVVMHRSIFDGGENDGMITTFFLDRDRLLLTHYCEAKNQPTLVASTIDNATNSVTFRFLSGTNMESRDVGHMDSAIYRFIDANRITHQWTWYAKGREKWLETIEEQRSTTAN